MCFLVLEISSKVEAKFAFTPLCEKNFIFKKINNLMKNTSLTAPGALAYPLQCLTALKIQNGSQGAPNGRRGLEKGLTLEKVATEDEKNIFFLN